MANESTLNLDKLRLGLDKCGSRSGKKELVDSLKWFFSKGKFQLSFELM